MQQIQSSNPKYNPHPLAEFFPLMEGQEFDELVGDIKRRGLHFPITIFDNQIIDGRTRYQACLKAGVEPRYVAFAGKAEDVPRFIISANIHRRHLKPQQRRELLKRLLNLHPELSNRAIANMAHVSHVTVGTVRTKMQSTGQIDQLKKTVGKDGKARKQPAKRKSRDLPSLSEIIAQPCEEDERCTECNGTNQTSAAEIGAAREQYLAAAKPLTKEEKMNEILMLLRAFGLVLYPDLVDYLKLTLAAEAS
jgi:hypothetical protein